MVEGSSPSPVISTENHENSQETLRNEGFLLRTRPELALSLSRTETNENHTERLAATTETTTLPLSDDLEFGIVAAAWTDLPAVIRRAIVAMVRASAKRGSAE